MKRNTPYKFSEHCKAKLNNAGYSDFKPKYYHTCAKCKANLDPGETCHCSKIERIERDNDS